MRVLKWLDAGRSSVVAALALALVVPSVNVTVFDGLPLEGAWEFGALAALLPFVFSASLRDRLARALRSRLPWGHRAVLAGAMLAIVVKILLLAFGSDRGFVGCYASTWRPPDTRCERSYSNLFQRHDGATRVDPELDFGPSGDQASNLIVTPSVTAYREGVSRTDWDFSFANDLRFNEAPGVALSLHQFMPFEARWTGRAAIPDDGEVQIRYAGQGKVEIGGTVVALPVSLVSRIITAQVPPGDQQLDAEFAFQAVHGATLAEFRLLTQAGEPIPAAAPHSSSRLRPSWSGSSSRSPSPASPRSRSPRWGATCCCSASC